MDIEEYIKGNDSLEKKEKYLRDVIDTLDKESFELFNEIIDLSDESVYKIIPLYERTHHLTEMYNSVLEAINYINKIEASSFEFAFKRYQLKKLLISLTTMSTFLLNAILGIFSFVVLTKKANKDFADELVEIYNSMETIDDDKVKIILRTLDNCARLLNGKKNKIFEHLKEIQPNIKESLCVMICNDAIRGFINDEVSLEQINSLDPFYKDTIVNILKKDLNIDTCDLNELLLLAKENSKKDKMLLLENKMTR